MPDPDPDKRRIYDQVGAEGLKNNGMPGGFQQGHPGFAGFGDPFKLFEQMFGGGGGGGMPGGFQFHADPGAFGGGSGGFPGGFPGGGFGGFPGGGGMPGGGFGGGFGGQGFPGGFEGGPGGGRRRRAGGAPGGPGGEPAADLYGPSSKVLRLTSRKFPDHKAKVSTGRHLYGPTWHGSWEGKVPGSP